MRAVICREFAPRAELTLDDVPAPTPGADDVLIDVAACGINFFDGLMVEGNYQTKPDRPFSPGSEVAGIVRAVGSDVTTVTPGDRVLAFTGTGGYAEQAVAPARSVHPIPDSMRFEQAAGFVITYATSHHALNDRAALQAGETVLVLGAAGGVGLTAIEIAKQMGARVIAAASTDEKLDLCRTHGADETINYTNDDLRTRLKEICGKTGVDVVYDPVGGGMAEAAIRSLAINGRYLVIGFASGDIPKIPLNLLLLKQSSLIGVFWGAFARANPDLNAANMAELFDWFQAGHLNPHIGGEYPMDRYAEALDAVMERRAQGKVVLTMPGAELNKRTPE
ncbi:NADPH:quinone oxidoreductase family protein [Marivita sp. S2033]|uniref:NADPH:quinone oxidoreductase family protein n=1 Tax=Marivita sp. S2033 TaxID=3373187 RepID=UPI0039824FAC